MTIKKWVHDPLILGNDPFLYDIGLVWVAAFGHIPVSISCGESGDAMLHTGAQRKVKVIFKGREVGWPELIRPPIH